MSGPIVRTGTNPKFWEGWDKVFADKPKAAAATKKTVATETAQAAPAKKSAVPAKKAVAKKSTKKKG
jgi:hypothetical protein